MLYTKERYVTTKGVTAEVKNKLTHIVLLTQTNATLANHRSWLFFVLVSYVWHGYSLHVRFCFYLCNFLVIHSLPLSTGHVQRSRCNGKPLHAFPPKYLKGKSVFVHIYLIEQRLPAGMNSLNRVVSVLGSNCQMHSTWRPWQILKALGLLPISHELKSKINYLINSIIYYNPYSTQGFCLE